MPLWKPALLWLALFLLSAAFHGHSKEAITGPQYRDATLNSIDVLSSHLTLLQAQADHDRILNNISYTIRFAPAGLRMNDNSVHEGSFVRSLLPVSVGWGTVDGIGIFLGLQGDYIKVFDNAKDDPNMPSWEVKGAGSEVSQLIAFAGVSFLGFQFDAGIMGGRGFKLDRNHEFARYASQLAEDSSALSNPAKFVYTMYHKSGVYLSAIINVDTATQDKSLGDFKLNIQPLESYLPEFYGLPYFDLLSYSPLGSYYSEYVVQDTGDTGPVKKPGKDYEVSLGSDNFYVDGFRPNVTLKVRPSIAFRKMDFSYVKAAFDGRFVAGARTSYFLRDGSNLSVEGFTGISFTEEITVGASYSYNSPESSTFLPLPGLHVFGLQLIYGAKETAKMLFPYAATLIGE